MKVFINFVMGVWKIIFFEVFSCWVNMVSFLGYVFCCYFFFNGLNFGVLFIFKKLKIFWIVGYVNK